MIEIVWERGDGQFSSFTADEDSYPEVPARLAGARAAMAISLYADERHPLLTAVLPDDDGIVRARWAADC